MPRHYLLTLVIALASLLFLLSCARSKSSPSTQSAVASNGQSQNAFDAYMDTAIPIADGFDFAAGDPNGKGSYQDLSTGITHNGWYIATQFNESYPLGIHTGEDWNGSGGGNTDLGQPVHAVANGKVTFAEHCGRLWGNVVMIEHHYYENHERRVVISLYAHLNEIKVTAGQIVERRSIIATIGQDPDKTFLAHLHLELRTDPRLAPTYWPSSDGKNHDWVREHYLAPSDFISQHRKLANPQNEKTLVLVDQTSYKARLYQSGKLIDELDVAFGQGRGQKFIQGDNKTPKGMYFVVQKHRGQFDGPYAKYYGGHWIKINYPNSYDADRGVTQGLISAQQKNEISSAWEKRALTLQNTRLGGGIGFHGWIKEWENDGPRHLSWGCVVVHLRDIGKLYDALNEGAMVVIF